MEALIRRVRDPFGALGNMAPFPVVCEGPDGLYYPTSEALFQAMRFGLGSEIAEQIRAQRSPMAAKMVAKKQAAQMLVKPRSEDDVTNMRQVLWLKYHQHAEVRKVLVSTGSERIIEDCSARPTESGLFWGAKKTDDGWTGENVLGELWMKLRTVRVKRYLVEDPFETLVFDADDPVLELSRRHGWVLVMADGEYLRAAHPELLIEEDAQYRLL